MMRRAACLIVCGLFMCGVASANGTGWRTRGCRPPRSLHRGTWPFRLPAPPQPTETAWTRLFDGTTLSGWKSYSGKPIGGQWVVEDGAIHLTAGGGGDIVTEKEFGDFEFQFQWKVAPGANSGVMYRVRPGDEAPYYSGLEYQVLDDFGHRDGGNPKTSAAALYGLIAGEGKELKPVGEWNTGRIVVKGNHIEHWLNGRKVVETERGTDAWRAMIADSKFKDWKQFAGAPAGMICLQDHGDKVWFRDLKIRELKQD